MKFLMLVSTFFLVSTVSISAQKFISKSGFVKFHSHTPVEEIMATNNVAASIFDPSSGEVQVSMLIRSFSFKKKLMQEHFNENYMESDVYPKSTFKGKVVNIDQVDFKKDGVYTIQIEGDITIHGVTKELLTQGTIEIQKGIPTAKTDFTVLTKDFNIQIPDLVKDKIAKEIKVTVNIQYNAK